MKTTQRKDLIDQNLSIPALNLFTAKEEYISLSGIQVEIEQPVLLEGEFWNTVIKVQDTVYLVNSIDLEM